MILPLVVIPGFHSPLTVRNFDFYLAMSLMFVSGLRAPATFSSPSAAVRQYSPLPAPHSISITSTSRNSY